MSSNPPSTSTRLPRTTLAEQVRDYIVLGITQGRISPGTPLREMELAQQLGTSQTPVREAFKELTALGLLESRVHVGTRVRNVAGQDLLDAVPVRAALEGLAGRMAVERSIDLSVIQDEFENMLSIASGGDRLAYASASTQFHRALIRSTRNESLLRAWNALGIEVMTIMSVGPTGLPLQGAAESHRDILEAIASGDAARAERVLTEHVSHYLPATP